MSLTKVAIELYNEFDMKTLREVFSEMESGNLQEKDNSLIFRGLGIIWQMVKKNIWNDSSLLHERTKEKLRLIPTSLRKRVLEVVEEVHYEVWRWLCHHKNIDRLFHKNPYLSFSSSDKTIFSPYSTRNKINDHSKREYYYPSWNLKCHEKCTSCIKFTFFWRSDGTIEREKTAQELVRNENVDLRARFEIACMYCLVDSVQTLWAELEANGEAEDCERTFTSISGLWITLTRSGKLDIWTQAMYDYLLVYNIFLHFDSLPRFSAIFRELMPADRRKFFEFLPHTDADDVRFCLYMVTNEEQGNILKNAIVAANTLWEHIEWPLTSVFLETSGRMYEYVQYFDFCLTIEKLQTHKETVDFDFMNLAMEFFSRAPPRLKCR